ncbi:putative integral membrane protein [Cryptosporidium felis]|nr:putative integral membrane protein [Cryptosporidium felis]
MLINRNLAQLFLLLIFGSAISLISNTSKIYSIIIEDLKKKIFKEETILSYIYSISIIGFCIIPSGIIFSRPNASRNVLLYGILITLFGYISLYVTQRICVYYMMAYLLNDLSDSIFLIFSYGISFALILQGGVTLNLGSLWINLLYWPIKYSGLITSIQFTMYSVGGLTLSEIYRKFFLESGSIRHFFLTCFCISLFVGFLSIYMIISIEKKILSKNEIMEFIEPDNFASRFENNHLHEEEEGEEGEEMRHGNALLKELEKQPKHSELGVYESGCKNFNEILLSNDDYYNEYSKSERINKQLIINKILHYERKLARNFIVRNCIINDQNEMNQICNQKDYRSKNSGTGNALNSVLSPQEVIDNINRDAISTERAQEEDSRFNKIKSSILNFIGIISNLETISLIFVYLFTISTGQFFGTFIQRFSIYYIPNITKEKSIRMIQILTSVELFVRVISGYVSDLLANNRIMHKSTQTIILTLIMSLSLLLINYLQHYWLVVIFGVGFSYAGMYSVAPSYIRSLYSPTEFALVNSFCYSMVIPGNLILSLVLANTPQKYTTSLQIIGYLSLIPLSIMLIYKAKCLIFRIKARNKGTAKANEEVTNYRDTMGKLVDFEEKNLECTKNASRIVFQNLEYGIDQIVRDIKVLQKDISKIQKVISELNVMENNERNKEGTNIDEEEKIENLEEEVEEGLEEIPEKGDPGDERRRAKRDRIEFTVSTSSSSSSMLSFSDINKGVQES